MNLYTIKQYLIKSTSSINSIDDIHLEITKAANLKELLTIERQLMDLLKNNKKYMQIRKLYAYIISTFYNTPVIQAPAIKIETPTDKESADVVIAIDEESDSEDEVLTYCTCRTYTCSYCLHIADEEEY